MSLVGANSYMYFLLWTSPHGKRQPLYRERFTVGYPPSHVHAMGLHLLVVQDLAGW